MEFHRSLNWRLRCSLSVGGVPPRPAGPDRKVAGSARGFSATRPAGSAGPLWCGANRNPMLT